MSIMGWPNTCVVILSMLGKNTLDVSSALVFVSPKWPVWAKFTARFQETEGRTTQFSHKIKSPV